MRSSRNFICSIFTRYSRGCRITAILAAAFLLGSCRSLIYCKKMTENTMRSSRNFICSIFTRYSRGCRITAILAAAFLLGSCTGSLVTWISQNFQKTSSVPSISESTAASILSASSDSWGLSFQELGSCTGSLVTWISQNFQKTSSVPSISESTAASILSASSDSWGLSFQEKGRKSCYMDQPKLSKDLFRSQYLRKYSCFYPFRLFRQLGTQLSGKRKAACRKCFRRRTKKI